MYPTRGRRNADPAGRPSTSTEPPAIRWTPTIERMSVDLPLPLGPRRPVTDPAATLQLSPGRTTTPRRVTRRPSMRIAGSIAATEPKHEQGIGRPRVAGWHSLSVEKQFLDAGAPHGSDKLPARAPVPETARAAGGPTRLTEVALPSALGLDRVCAGAPRAEHLGGLAHDARAVPRAGSLHAVLPPAGD